MSVNDARARQSSTPESARLAPFTDIGSWPAAIAIAGRPRTPSKVKIPEGSRASIQLLLEDFDIPEDYPRGTPQKQSPMKRVGDKHAET